MVLMITDVGLLAVWVLCSLVLAQEDGNLTRITRVPVLLVGFFAFNQAAWLLSVWEPSPVYSYPLPRVALDAAGAAAFISRTIVVLSALRRNSGHLITIRPFGVTKH
jgi:hypothetical protein